MTAVPRITDNDRDEITASLDGKEIRGWSYGNESERRVKMLCAHEFAEGWYQHSIQVIPVKNTIPRATLDDHCDHIGNLSADGTRCLSCGVLV